MPKDYKKCSICKKCKNSTLFYKRKDQKNGYRKDCKSCRKKCVRKRAAIPEVRLKIIKYSKDRFQEDKLLGLPTIRSRIYNLRNPGKKRARQKINNYIRDGKLSRKPCEVCKSTNSQAHHSDYRKPLEVKWLCFKHHREKHGQLPSLPR